MRRSILGRTNLDIALQMTPNGSAAQPVVDAMTEAFIDAFVPQGTLAGVLLDTMQEIGSPPSDFADARTTGEWDTITTDWVERASDGASIDSTLRSSIEAWVKTGTAALAAGSMLSAQAQSSLDDPSHALLTLLTVAGMNAADADSPIDDVASISADPGDTVHLGDTVFFLPSSYVGSAGEAGAATIGTSPTDLMFTIVECSQLSAQLYAAAPLPSPCVSAACMERLCWLALAQMWDVASESSATTMDVGTIAFAVSAHATVDGNAAIKSISGPWEGSFTFRDQTKTVKGTVSSSTP